ncbi:MAG: hypothetical protein HYW06_11740 [Gemmatimonadetes bacterium]|nr:hypothetical protein [Gemmatimonadota bacterium]MBI2401153.1 hypothetical protein [Gemmatimonadota bacterium]MBI2537607.1 hypothetical protein [Gemmatimonadota bacterium]MBI2616229.1 hypothetical protein [Gemmatimonadota bacterium]MBI3082552.1 hypothetical protein [Gemmatimonadota bacterium]
MSGPEVLIPITFFVSAAAAIIFRGPIGKAIAEAIRRAPPWTDRPPQPDLDVERMSGELEELRHRLAELEERQDFAERLLAQQRDRAVLGRGGTEAR